MPDSWKGALMRKMRSRSGITLDASGPARPPGGRAKWVFALLLLLSITAVAVAEYSTSRGLIPIAWLAVGPLLASLVLSPRITAVLEVVPDDNHPRWLIGDTRGKGLPAVRLASVAMTSFRDACAQPGLSLPEIARVVDRSVTRAAGDEDFVTAVFAELDPRGWLQLVICGHPPPLRLTAEGGLQALTPRSYATPLGMHPDVQPSTFTVNAGDRLVFFTDGLLEARDRASIRDCCPSGSARPR